MKSDVREIGKDSPQLRVVQASEEAAAEDLQVDLEKERKTLAEQAEAEEFWAGRNLAGRNSARRAA
ncbi:MAG TPA: hypothetical protein VIH42_08705 [Thermoguttaceae bacterium]